MGECQWTPIAQEDREISRPLASSLVPTRLALGPERVSAGPNSPRASALAGAEDVVPQHGAADDYDYEALTSPRGHTTLGKKVPVAKQRDGLVRRKRLDIFLVGDLTLYCRCALDSSHVLLSYHVISLA